MALHSPRSTVSSAGNAGTGLADTTPLRVLAVNFDAILAAGLREMLPSRSGFDLKLASIDAGGSAPKLTEHDVALLDLDLGVDTARLHLATLTNQSTSPVAILTSGAPNFDAIYPLLASGANGLIRKSAGIGRFQDAIRTIASGAAWIDSAYLAPLLAQFRRSVVPKLTDSKALSTLSARELSVTRLVGLGLSNGEIAKQLFLSVGTVKAHLVTIRTRLNLRDRAALIRFAIEQGLAELEPS